MQNISVYHPGLWDTDPLVLHDRLQIFNLKELDNLLLKLINGDHLIYLEDYCCLVCDAALTQKTVICIFSPIRTSHLNAYLFLFTVPGVDSTVAVVMRL